MDTMIILISSLLVLNIFSIFLSITSNKQKTILLDDILEILGGLNMTEKKKIIPTDIKKRIEYLDEQWYCPNCGETASVRFEYGVRIIKCKECGEFIVGIVIK